MIQADLVVDPGTVAIPAGDPAALRAAASTLSATAEALEGAAAIAEGVVGGAVPAAWAGSAARACGGAQERAVADCRALVRATREAAAAVAQLAAELDEAISDAGHAAAQAAEVSAALLRIDRMAVDIHAAEHADLQARAHQLASEAAHLHLKGTTAAERARLANVTAAAAFDQVTATLPRIATLGAECGSVTRSQLAALLGRPVSSPIAPGDQDAESLLGLGAFLAGGVLVDFAKKDRGKGRAGSRAGAAATPGGGPGGGGPPGDQGRKHRTMPGAIWSAQEAEQKALAMGFVKTKFRSMDEVVYRRGRRYISRDLSGHNGGAWKMADSPLGLLRKQTRIGTYDQALTQRVGN